MKLHTRKSLSAVLALLLCLALTAGLFPAAALAEPDGLELEEDILGCTTWFYTDPYEEPYAEQEVPEGSLLTAPDWPSREGFFFGGWYVLDEDAGWEEDSDHIPYVQISGDEEEGIWVSFDTLLYNWDEYNGDNYMRRWNFAEDTVEEDVWLYAKWTAPVLALGENELHIFSGEIIECSFTPAEDGLYRFSSDSVIDPKITLSDPDSPGEILFQDDDSGEELQFDCYAELEADKCYLIQIREYSGEEGDLLVTVSQPKVSAITVDENTAHGRIGAGSLEYDDVGYWTFFPWESAPEGRRVLLFAAPDQDCALVDFTVTDANGQNVPVAYNGEKEDEVRAAALSDGEPAEEEENELSEYGWFFMPDSAVTVTAAFGALQPLQVSDDGRVYDAMVYTLTGRVWQEDDDAYPIPAGAEVTLWVRPLVGQALSGLSLNGVALDCVPVDDFRFGEAWQTVSFTMPDEAASVTLSTSPAAYPALSLGENTVSSRYAVFSFTPEENGFYYFSVELDEEASVRLELNNAQGFWACEDYYSYEGFVNAPLLGGETYYLCYYFYLDEGMTLPEAVTLTVSAEPEEFDVFSITVDPNVAGGVITPSVTAAPEKYGVVFTVEPAPGFTLDELRVAWLNAEDEPVETSYSQYDWAVPNVYLFTMPAAAVTVSARFRTVYDTPDFTLPADVNRIEESAFQGADMSVVYIPDGCEEIGKWAFKDCLSLRQIRVPAGCVIDEHAFDGCGTVCVFAPAGSEAEVFCESAPNCIFVTELPDELSLLE